MDAFLKSAVQYPECIHLLKGWNEWCSSLLTYMMCLLSLCTRARVEGYSNRHRPLPVYWNETQIKFNSLTNVNVGGYTFVALLGQLCEKGLSFSWVSDPFPGTYKEQTWNECYEIQKSYFVTEELLGGDSTEPQAGSRTGRGGVTPCFLFGFWDIVLEVIARN